MREIKFRAWDKVNREFRKDGLMVRIDGKGVASSNPEHYILQQFTGLLDKNGKEIYEGDIVKDGEGVGIVYWIKEFVCFAVQELPTRDKTFAFGKDLSIKDGQLKETEIIGNLYENPELIK